MRVDGGPMKTISTGLKTFIQSNESVLRVELLTITLQQGAGVLRYTSLDQDVVYNGYSWLSGDGQANPGWKRGSISCGIGTDTKTMDLTLFCGPSTLINGVLVPTFADYGGLDNAIIEVDSLPVAYPAAGQSINTANGTVNLWTGIAGEITADRTEVRIEVSSLLRILQGAYPRNYTLPTCNNTLYDSACTLIQASYAVTGSVVTGSWTTNSFDTNLTQINDYFDQGWIVWTSGANHGLVRTVKLYQNSGGNLLITYPLPYVPQSGDTFTAYPGCDKTQATCTNKFNNLIHYRGFPYMPNPMTLFAGSQPTPGAGGGSANSGPGGTGGNFRQF